MKEILNSDIDLLELEQKLSKFKDFHLKKGVELVYKKIHSMKNRRTPMESNREDYYIGYDMALNDVLAALRAEFNISEENSSITPKN